MPNHKDAEYLTEAYHERGLSLQAIADETDVAISTVQYWFNKHGIDTRKANQEKPPHYHTDTSGYEYWVTSIDGENKHFAVHRLLAVAEYGFDAVAGNDIHHFNRIPWDNRPRNIVVEDHARHGDGHLTGNRGKA